MSTAAGRARWGMWDDSLRAEIERLTAGIAALRSVYRLIHKGAEMGKLSAIADRIKDTKARLEAEADKLGAKLDVIDKEAPKAFARGHAFIDAQAAEVAEIEDTLRQLSNLPLDESTSSPAALPAAAPEVPAPKPTFPAGPDAAA